MLAGYNKGADKVECLVRCGRELEKSAYSANPIETAMYT